MSQTPEIGITDGDVQQLKEKLDENRKLGAASPNNSPLPATDTDTVVVASRGYGTRRHLSGDAKYHKNHEGKPACRMREPQHRPQTQWAVVGRDSQEVTNRSACDLCYHSDNAMDASDGFAWGECRECGTETRVFDGVCAGCREWDTAEDNGGGDDG